MSAQTHEVIPEAPASQRLADRARYRIDRLIKAPNPIWMRELRQSTRLSRTPFILMSVTIMATLIIAAIGGSMADSARIDEVGQAMFHTFFGLAFFVVACAGPALAANSIASEREGRTWEAVVLTGMSPQVIVRGKFLAALTDIGSYIVMLAPVGALCFFFGGVAWLEVVIGFAYLLVFAVLSVAFGLAVASKMGGARGAIVVTLLLAIPVSGTLFGAFGPGLSIAVHELWPAVPAGPPIWLPIAYVRGTFGLDYVLLLFGVPLLVLGLPAWFLYEATIASLTEPNADRSTGLKRWFVVASLSIVLAGVLACIALPFDPGGRVMVACLWVVGFLLFLIFCVVVFMGEPLAASRRVLHQWKLHGVSKLNRFLGPSLSRTAGMLLVISIGGFLLLVGATAIGLAFGWPPGSHADELVPLGLFTFYLTGFCVFCVGLAVWLRARSNNVFGARMIFLVVLGGFLVLPGMVAAIAGVAFRAKDAAIALASPSPVFCVALLDSTPEPTVVVSGMMMAILWTGIGIGALGAGNRRARGVLAAYDEQVAHADAVLAQEDAAANAPPEAGPGADPEPSEPGSDAEPSEPGSEPEPEPDSKPAPG